MKNNYYYCFLTEYIVQDKVYGSGIWAKSEEHARDILKERSKSEIIIGQQASPTERGMFRKTEEQLRELKIPITFYGEPDTDILSEELNSLKNIKIPETQLEGLQNLKTILKDQIKFFEAMRRERGSMLEYVESEIKEMESK